MSASRVVMVGEMTLDDVVYEDRDTRWTGPGGGALYSAIGARLWGAVPTICASVGNDYPDLLLEAISDAGIDVTGVTRVADRGLSIWLLYETNGLRQQVPKLQGASFEDLDGVRQPWPSLVAGDVDAIHIAPQTVQGQIDALEPAVDRNLLATVDVMVEPFIDIDGYRFGDALEGASALLLNETEMHQIWGDIAPLDVLQQIGKCSDVEYLVVKQGAEGAFLTVGDEIIHIPALSQASVDPTGAGDAFCGGFLIGLCESGDPLEALIYGAVSASFAIEVQDARALLGPVDERQVSDRLKYGRRRVRKVA